MRSGSRGIGIVREQQHPITLFANPYLQCTNCGRAVIGFILKTGILAPCGHFTAADSACPTWSPVDGCTCPHLGDHFPERRYE